MKYIVRHIIFLLMMVAATGCQDDFLEIENIGEGQATVTATLDFKPMSSALTRTRAAGDALKDITSLYVLLYDYQTQTLRNGEPWKINLDAVSISDENRTDSDAEGGNGTAEKSTKRVTFKLPEEIEFGRYYMYAVANLPELESKYHDEIQTVDGLKSIPLTWNNDPAKIAENGQMLGHFTNASGNSGYGDECLVVKEKSVKLHAWLRRAASKVTVAFDGSALKEGVFIYLQSVQIKDIPTQCYLGKENNVGKEGYGLSFPENGPDMQDGEILYYHKGELPGEDFVYGEACADHRITSGHPKLEFDPHAEDAPALYFYENMQGAGVDMPDKRQDANGDNILDFPGLPNAPDKYPDYRLKDNVKYGTYIEVRAHYISNNSERLGNGYIIYRFMLGQDVINDYNAKRNCHYKLTLKFKNFANDADWHIEYEEPEPGVITPEPYFITYLYNHSMMYPIKVNTGGHKIEFIKAEIIENNWAPHNADPIDYYAPAAKGRDKPWDGFLSLHKTVETVIGNNDDAKEDINKDFYNQPPMRGLRIYTDFTEGEHPTNSTEAGQSAEDDLYRVEKHPNEENTYSIFIPMYSRAKQLFKSTGYTGNNPYVGYQRKAVVRITTKLAGVDEPYKNEVPIYQVRRLENPKGIYRSANNNKSFHVVLKHLQEENATNFEPFQSEGPWKAYIVKETNASGITLSAMPGATLKPDPEYGTAIHGKTGSKIDFKVNFSGCSSENRYAIIRVEYHNYTCQHLIFVRQGDKPDALVDGGAEWYAMNMRTKSELASTPLDEGSLFKFAEWDYPIDALSNKNPFSAWINITAASFVAPGELSIAGTDQKKIWERITSANRTTMFAYKPSHVKFVKPQMLDARVATNDDYMQLRKSTDIEQGYGVLYGDDATETANDIVEAYGYDYANANKGRGMRGCFVYNKVTGKNLFFPLGASGYGHRKQSYTGWGDIETLDGVLRYACGRTKQDSDPIYKPLLYDLYKRHGAIYWFQEMVYADPALYWGDIGWDINYFTFDFNPISALDVIRGYGGEGGSDACFIRCVRD